MILKRIKVENYRRFQSLELEFPENVIGIIGKNGAGKSSLLEAVGWALYGTRAARTDKLEIRSQFSGEASAAGVELEFVYGDREYRVVRRIKGKNAVAEAAVYVSTATAPEAVQERGVNEYIENLLKLDHRSFLASVFARQKELAALSGMQPEERRRTINRLIGIDAIDDSRERVRRDRNEQQKYLEGMRHSLLDPEALQSRYQNLQAQQAEVQSELARLSEETGRRRQSLAQCKSRYEALAKLRDQNTLLSTRLVKDQGRLQECENSERRLQDELAVIKEAEKELAEIRPKVVEIERLKAEKEEWDRLALRKTRQEGLEQARRHLDEQQQSLRMRLDVCSASLLHYDALVAELQALNERLRDAEEAVQDLRQQYNESSGRRTHAERNGREWVEKAATLRQLGPKGVCPTCTQPLLGHYEQALAEIEQTISQLRQEYVLARDQEKTLLLAIREKETAVEALRRQKEELVKRQAGLDETKKQLAQLTAERKTLQERHEQNQAQLAELGAIDYDADAHAACTERVAAAQAWLQKQAQLEERVGRRSKLEADLSAAQKARVEISKDLDQSRQAQAALNFNEADFQFAKAEVDRESQALDQSQEELSGCRETMARVAGETESLAQTIQEQAQKGEQIKLLDEEVRYLEALDMHLGRFRLELAGRIRPLLAHRASQLLALVSNNRYQWLELDEDYGIQVYDANQAFGVNRFSGGEQDLVNLCLRIAISQVVAERSGGFPVNFLVLDEVFASQDEERKQSILDALNRLSSQFRQIFMITHVEAIKEILPVILEVRFRDAETSEAVWR